MIIVLCPKRIVKILLFLFLSTNLIYSQEKLFKKNNIKYFLDTNGFIENEIASVHNHFQNELDKHLNPYKNTLLSKIIKSIKKFSIHGYYKVYYNEGIPIAAERIELTGYYYMNERLKKDINSTKKNLGVVFKYDEKGRTVYSVNGDEICEIFYGFQYRERTCTIDKEISTTKNYYKNNKFKIYIFYKNGELLDYGTSTGNYNKDGKKVNPILYNLKRKYNKFYNQLDDGQRKMFQDMIKEEEEKFKNIPDLNLILVNQYIKEIDKINK